MIIYIHEKIKEEVEKCLKIIRTKLQESYPEERESKYVNRKIYDVSISQMLVHEMIHVIEDKYGCDGSRAESELLSGPVGKAGNTTTAFEEEN